MWLRMGWRRVTRETAVSVVCVLTIGLGVGGAAAVFAYVKVTMLDPLPFPEANRIVQAVRRLPSGPGDAFSEPKAAYLREHQRSFSSLSAYRLGGVSVNVSGAAPDRLLAYPVTNDFFVTLGVRPQLGRLFGPADESGTEEIRAVMLSDSLWRRRFGGNPDTVGSTMILNGAAAVVVGVLPSEATYPEGTDIWFPLSLRATSTSRNNALALVGRVRQGVLPSAAAADLDALSRRFVDANPDDGVPGERLDVETLKERLFGQLTRPLLLLFSAVFLALVAAYVNVASLEFVRGLRYRHHLNIKLALGASSGQVLREALAESALIWAGGGVLGVAVVAAAFRGIGHFSALPLRGVPVVGLGLPVLIFVAITTMGAGLFAAAFPVFNWLGLQQRGVAANLNQVSRRLGVVRWLVTAELAVATVLTVVSILLVRDLALLRDTDTGFSARDTISMKLWLREPPYGSIERFDSFVSSTLGAVATLPSVEHASLNFVRPFEGGLTMPFTIEGRYMGGGLTDPGVGRAWYRPVTAAYFDALGIRTVRGRLFHVAATTGQVVVNETAARRFWPGGDVLGARITLGRPSLPQFADPVPSEIVGVVADVKELGLFRESPPIVYARLEQIAPELLKTVAAATPLTLLIKPVHGASPPIRVVQAAVWNIDPAVPVTDVRSVDAMIQRAMGALPFGAAFASVLAISTLIMAAVALYALIAYSVAAGTRDIAIRMIIGADAAAIARATVTQSLIVAGSGISLGLVAAVPVAQAIGRVVSGTSVRDMAAGVIAVGVLFLISFAATYVPVRRAIRIAPAEALRID